MIRKLILRSIHYYRQTNLWVILGTALSTAILTGSLMVGDSIRYSLEQIVFNRLGRTEFALSSGDRLFEGQLAERLAKDLNCDIAPLLQIRGIGIAEGGKRRYNTVQILGVDKRFGRIGSTDLFDDLGPDEVIINTALASRLELKPGDDLLLRMERLDSMPKDAPLAGNVATSLARRFKVKAVASINDFGGFNLKNDQISPHTAFLARQTILNLMELEDRANLLLAATRKGTVLSDASLRQALRRNWTLEDAGLTLVSLGAEKFEVRSERIFLDTVIEQMIQDTIVSAKPVFTYFVNEIRAPKQSVPYSFVTAADYLFKNVPADNEIIINQWLAAELKVKIDSEIALSYYVIGPDRNLSEETASFKVKSIVPLENQFADRNFMPDFPGLSEEVSCLDWDPGVPLDLHKIRDADEVYWERYRGIPKAYINLKTAKSLWQNRFGSLTALRYSGQKESELKKYFKAVIDPAGLGFYFRPLKAEGLQASSNSVDFGQLFLGLSFFVIAAALMLIGMLFVFNLKNRSRETGLFMALGFSRSLIGRFILLESLLLAAAGSIAGGLIGIFVNEAILLTLKTVWQGIVGTSALQSRVLVSTVFTGMISGIIMAFSVISLMGRRQLKQSAAFLQKGGDRVPFSKIKYNRWNLPAGTAGIISLILIIIFQPPTGGGSVSGFYFGAGALFICSGLIFMNIFLQRAGRPSSRLIPDINALALKNAGRNRMRSIMFTGLMASGIFIVFTVGANRKSTLPKAELRSSGTGGFAFIGESAIPLIEDLNTKKGRETYRLESLDDRVSFVQFKVKSGDDASCLNLNRISHPGILGVDPDQLIRRNAFTFARTVEDADSAKWSLLNEQLSGPVIPGIADLTVIIWGLGVSVGDTLTYVDEQGERFKIRLMGGLANSVLQGRVIISEKNFLQRYPSISGQRFFLVDAPESAQQKISRKISRSLQDEGFDLYAAPDRLAEFSNIENTYLSIFLILGSFGLLIGSIGIGIVVKRNVNERRGEFSLMYAVGFTHKLLQQLILREHIFLLLCGVVLGCGAVFFPLLPLFLTPGAVLPLFTLVILFILVIINGGLWTMLAASRAISERPVQGLRNE